MNRKWFAVPAIASLLALMFVGVPYKGKILGGAKVANAATCVPTAWRVTSGAPSSGTTVSVSPPNIPAGCTQNIIEFISASIYDTSESCSQTLEVLDGGTGIFYDSLIAGGNVNHPSDSRIYPFPSNVAWINNATVYSYANPTLTHSTEAIEFSGHCANSVENIYITGISSF